MALPHAQSCEVVSLRPLGPRLRGTPTSALIKAGQLEVIRVVLPAGKEQHQHDAPGEVTLLCLEGEVLFQAGAQSHTLREGDFLHLVPRIPHVLRALQDASLLVTICLAPG